MGKIEIGTVLAGRYRIDRLRGSGGLGAVYEATDTLKPDERVAIKVLLDFEGGTTPKDEARFLQEAELAAQVKHPNVVAPKAFVPPKSGEPAFLVMELIADGEPLHRYIEQSEDKVLPIEEALDLTKQILSALATAHRLGVIHRDVKPANILVRFDDKTKKRTALLLDFGIATMLGERARVKTTTGVMLGTPGWAAPEQVRAEENIDARADVYAVGGCLYNMLTGKRAFTANDMVRQLAGHPPPRIANVPEWLADVVAKALEADPKKRFESAAEMLAAMAPSSSPYRMLGVTIGAFAIVALGVALVVSSRPSAALVVADAAQNEEASPPITLEETDASPQAQPPRDPPPPPQQHVAVAVPSGGPPPRCVCNGAKASFCDHPMPSQCSCMRDNNALCIKVDPANRDKCAVQLVLGTAGVKCSGFRRHRSHVYESETVEGTFEGCSLCYAPVESRRKYHGKSGDSCTGYDQDGVKQAGELSCLRDEER